MSSTGFAWGIYFDDLHIITVNPTRDEVRLHENGGSGTGYVLFKQDDSVAKVALSDPLQLMNMAFHFVVSYELLAQVAGKEALAYFERIGAKDFLNRLAAATPEQERRHRLNGLTGKFNTFSKPQPVERRGRPPSRAKEDGEQVSTT